MTGSHIHCKGGKILEMAQDRDRRTEALLLQTANKK